MVTFEAVGAEEIETNFHNAVDEYIQTCKELTREPQKVYKGVFNVRIEPELHKKILRSIKSRNITQCICTTDT